MGNQENESSFGIIGLFLIACVGFIVLLPIMGIVMDISESLDNIHGTDFFSAPGPGRHKTPIGVLIFFPLIIFGIFSLFKFFKKPFSEISPLSKEEVIEQATEKLHLTKDELEAIAEDFFKQYSQALDNHDISIVADILSHKSNEYLKEIIEEGGSYVMQNVEIVSIESILDNGRADMFAVNIAYEPEGTNEEINEVWTIEFDEDMKKWILQDIRPSDMDFQYNKIRDGE